MRGLAPPLVWVLLALWSGCQAPAAVDSPVAQTHRSAKRTPAQDDAEGAASTESAFSEVVRRPMKRAELVLERDAEGMGRLSLQPTGLAAEPIPCDRLEGAWGLWVDDVDGDGRAEAIVALRKRARFDNRVENRLHVYSFEQGRCVPAWRGTRLAGRFEALAREAERGALVAAERVSATRRRLVRYRWRDFGYRLEDILWEGEGAVPEAVAAPYEFTKEPT